MEEEEQLTIDDRINNLKIALMVIQHELEELLKQKEYKPIWFIIPKKEWQKSK